ncbi:hypothetical protein RCL1_005078 [Eukaryota sp. TZLM3-RCL]
MVLPPPPFKKRRTADESESEEEVDLSSSSEVESLASDDFSLADSDSDASLSNRELFSDNSDDESINTEDFNQDDEEVPMIDDFEGVSDSSDVSDTEEFETKAKKFASKVKKVVKEAKEELAESNNGLIEIEFPETEEAAFIDRSTVNERIQSILKILANFSQRRDPQISRSQYLARLTLDLGFFYDYLPSIITKLMRLFGVHELVQYLEHSSAPRPLVIRTNTLKTRRKDLAKSLISRGVNLEPIEWSKVGLIVFDSQVPVGATPEYLSGQYMIQSASSLLPVMALDPKPHETILDMCSAPGGKTTHIAQILRGTGMVVANDVNEARTAGLIANIHRLGVHNSVVVNYDGRKLKDRFGLFDRVLLDAPCSGLGVVDKDPSAKMSRDDDDIKRTTHLQKELLRNAIDLCKTGGIIIYSTCSVTLDENEGVVDYAISTGKVVVEDSMIPFGEPGILINDGKKYDQSIKLARRFYPHIHNIHGFFVCRLKKL